MISDTRFRNTYFAKFERVDLPGKSVNPTKYMEGRMRNQDCNLIVTLSSLSLRKSSSVVCAYFKNQFNISNMEIFQKIF